MPERKSIHCPNCGQAALQLVGNLSGEIARCPGDRFTRTECPTCDYLMVSCSLTGRVVEAYAPSLEMSHWKVIKTPVPTA